MRKSKEYAYYRGDEFVMIGTIQEIADANNYKVKTLEIKDVVSNKEDKERMRKYIKMKAAALCGL